MKTTTSWYSRKRTEASILHDSNIKSRLISHLGPLRGTSSPPEPLAHHTTCVLPRLNNFRTAKNNVTGYGRRPLPCSHQLHPGSEANPPLSLGPVRADIHLLLSPSPPQLPVTSPTEKLRQLLQKLLVRLVEPVCLRTINIDFVSTPGQYLSSSLTSCPRMAQAHQQVPVLMACDSLPRSKRG